MFYRVEIEQWYGPFCGRGGYGYTKGVGWNRSVARALDLASRNQRGDAGGMVPILYRRRIWRGSTLIQERT